MNDRKELPSEVLSPATNGKPASECLRLLADWFDTDDVRHRGMTASKEVQSDLRKWADELEALHE